MIGGLLIDWVDGPTGLARAGRSIAELEIRRRTRMTVVAIAAATTTAMLAPEPHEHRARRGPAGRCSAAGGPARASSTSSSAEPWATTVALGGVVPRRRGPRPPRPAASGCPTIPLVHGRRHPLRARTRPGIVLRRPIPATSARRHARARPPPLLPRARVLRQRSRRGRARCSSSAGIYLAPQRRRPGSRFGFALGWGNREALVIAGAVGISSSAIVTKLLIELNRLAEPGDARSSSASSSSRTSSSRSTSRSLQPVIGDDQGVVRRDHRRSARRSASSCCSRSSPARARALVGRLIDDRRRRAPHDLLRRPRGARRRHRRGGRRLRRHRRVHGRPHPRREPGRASGSSAWSCPLRDAFARGVLLRLRPHHRSRRRRRGRRPDRARGAS